MSIGTLIGGAAQLVMQIPSLYKVGFRFLPILSFTDEGVKKVMYLMAPAIIGTASVQINVLVNTFFASQINAGVSWLNFAFRLMQFPIGLFGVAIGTATLPAISRYASSGELDKKRGRHATTPTPSTGTRPQDGSPSPSNETLQTHRAGRTPGGVVGGAYSNSMMTSSTARLPPAEATIFLTLQSCSALRMFSIFIASMTASFSPAFTS